MGKTLYKMLSLLFGLLGGMIAGRLFKFVWTKVAGEEDAPDATDPDHSWREVMAATVIQGAIAAGVRAAVQRGGAEGIRKITGKWPASG